MKFDSYHPFINLLFFVAAIVMSLMFDHPVFICFSFICSFAYHIKLCKKKGLIINFVLIIIAIIFAMIFSYNVHFGVTVISHTFIDNQITLEALFFGLSLGIRIASAIMWLCCMINIFTTDKVVYLLGRVAPRASLFLAILLRSIPVIVSQGKKICEARMGLGFGPGQGSVLFRLKNWIKRISILITWSIERFVMTSESMRCRGLQLRGRTAYSLYRFDNRDRAVVLIMIASLSTIIAGALLNQTSILYAPSIVFNKITPWSFAFYLAYFVFCFLAFALQQIYEIKLRNKME